MFYQNPKSAFRILGVFYVERARREIFEHDRRHTALSYRITGSSVFEDAEGKKQARDGAVTYIPAGCDYRHVNRDHERILIVHLEQYGVADKTLQVLPYSLHPRQVISLTDRFCTLTEEYRHTSASSPDFSGDFWCKLPPALLDV